MTRLVEEVVVLVKKDMTRHRVRLDVKANGISFARVNPAQIQQVLLNLLINARQAMPGGGVVRLRFGLDATGRRAEISVADTGTGIAPADLRRIFEPFFSTKTEPDAAGQGGTGLGLAVCRDIVEAHHGRLRAESRLGQGSTFTIILPACPPPPRIPPGNTRVNGIDRIRSTLTYRRGRKPVDIHVFGRSSAYRGSPSQIGDSSARSRTSLRCGYCRGSLREMS